MLGAPARMRVMSASRARLSSSIGRLPIDSFVPYASIAMSGGAAASCASKEALSQCCARSARALKLLQEAGFGKLNNLEGGILAWAEQIDPSVPKY